MSKISTDSLYSGDGIKYNYDKRNKKNHIYYCCDLRLIAGQKMERKKQLNVNRISKAKILPRQKEAIRPNRTSTSANAILSSIYPFANLIKYLFLRLCIISFNLCTIALIFTLRAHVYFPISLCIHYYNHCIEYGFISVLSHIFQSIK